MLKQILVLLLLVVTLALLVLHEPNASQVLGATSTEWKQRTIYQLLTDRFALPPGSPSVKCPDLGNYCGGTWSGIQANLDYISNMGFDAIWISPIVKNLEGGYHGYWMQDLWSLNSHFGTEKDLKNLVDACHQRNIFVMVDIVFNHVAPIGMNFAQISPFNQSTHYHPLCNVVDYNNQTQVELCRLMSLPDLDQSNSFVYGQLSQWLGYTIQKYGFDGIRLDTVPYIAKQFYRSIMSDVVIPKLNSMYIVGEVFDGRVDYAAGYANIIGGTLNYPLYFMLKNVYGSRGSMFSIRSFLQQSLNQYKDPTALGIFIDNHDNARFLNQFNDAKLYQNVLTFILFSQGVPMVYYGAEQGFSGGGDPNNREILWNSMNTKSYWYLLIQKMVTFRRMVVKEIWNSPYVERYVENNFYSFSRGNVFIATTNNGNSQSTLSYVVSDHDYAEGQVVCNIFWANDCIQVVNGALTIDLLNGESKIFYPKEKLNALFPPQSPLKNNVRLMRK